jgi:acetyl-CoA acyltransferase
MPVRVLAVADAIQKDVDAHLDKGGLTYKKLSLDDKLQTYLRVAVGRMMPELGIDFETLGPHITDFISFGPSIYEHHHTMDTGKKASMLGLTGIQLHSLDLGGATAPAALELAERIARDENRVVLIAGAEVPRGGPSSIAYYREVNDALLAPTTEAHTQSNLISLYALLADRLMHEEGVSIEHIEAITTHYRELAQKNERAATFAKPLKHGELKRYLAGPYATAMVAVATDHAAAVLVANEDWWQTLSKKLKAATPKNSLYIHASATNYGEKYLTYRTDFSSPGKLAAERAFARASISRTDIDYAWIYDCFTLMLVQQAADYFDLKPRDVAETLCEGNINNAQRKIQINLQGGILNTQAAISLSAISGLIDIMEYARNNTEAKNFLFGGNGGIDCINSVSLLTRTYSPGKNAVKSSETKLPARPKELQRGEHLVLYAAAEVRFNPGAEVPFTLGCFRRSDGSLCLLHILDSHLLQADPNILKRDSTTAKISFHLEKPVAILN